MNLLAICQLPPSIVDKLKQNFTVIAKPKLTEADLLKTIPDIDILIIRSETKVTKKVLAVAKKLKIIGRIGIGLDNIDLEETRKLKIPVLNTPHGNSISVAELVFGIIFTLYRNLNKADNGLKKGYWLKSELVGHELYKKTLGIIGLGNIGKIVAKLANAFGMKVIGFDPFLEQNQFAKLKIKPIARLPDLLKIADIITLHIPKTKKTINLIDEKELKLMKKTALLINCSRGEIVNEKALYQALKQNRLAGAGIDTWENEPIVNNPLQLLPNVLALPHLGASTREAQERCVNDLIQQIFNIYPKNLKT